ncbi:hypothetical protein C7999DRAFT_44818 [Corynascus novoguineensis]|uniref:Uncharacterized protein n=1 Tax=Corynascus novoguineensis TaxID=1126955 RepID=A0AAN7CJP3_9PEZI|nr:hypothetical protein C7999DRAFT_44818 [Corynascus novoguineensis]
MASNFLSGLGPAELIILIVEACESTRDSLALTSTCRALHHVGRAHAVARLWAELDKEILCVEEALIAVRMTELVADAERRHELPPYCKPTMAEVPALAIRKMNPFAWGFTYLRWLPDLPVATRGREVFICGAALAGAYNEPVYVAKSRPRLMLGPGQNPGHMSEKQLQFLEQFAVCNMNPSPEAEEAVFGPLSAWLFESILSDKTGRAAMARRFKEGYGRAWYCQHRSDYAHFIAWEIMQMLWVREHICRSVTRRRPFQKQNKDGTLCPDKDPRESPKPDRPVARAIFFGVFHTEDIDLGNLSPEGAPNPSARLAYIPAQDAAEYGFEPFMDKDQNTRPVTVWGSSVAVLFPWIRGWSGRPNWNLPTASEPGTAGAPVTPLANRFFDYFLRRHLGLRFRSDVLSDDFDPGYLAFLSSLAVFAHDDIPGRVPYGSTDASVLPAASYLDGTELLTRADPPPRRVFRHQSHWCTAG